MALYLGNERITPNLTTTVSGVIPSGTKNITDTSLTDVSLFQYAQVSDGNLVAENIKKDVSILGITGTLEATTPVSGTLQITSNGTFDVSDKQYAEVNVAARLSNPKTVTPSATSQTVLPDQGDDGLSQVTVSGDANLVAGNIKKDVSIFGVTGTLESSSGGSGVSLPDGLFFIEPMGSAPIDLVIPEPSSALPLRPIYKTSNGDLIPIRKLSIPSKCYGIYVEGMFKGNTTLEEVSLYGDSRYIEEDGSQSWLFQNIADSAFEGCSSLKTIDLPELSIKNLYTSAFKDCTSLVTTNHGNDSFGPFEIFKLPKTLQWDIATAPAYVFQNCSSLKYVDFSSAEKVLEIGNYCFDGCTSLSILANISKIKRIGACSFRNTAIVNLLLADTAVIRIGSQAFSNITTLTTVTLPATLTDIESSAFYGSTSITSIECHMITPPSIDTFTFDSSIASNAGFVITVPAGSGNAYKAATGWSQFADKIVESTEF